MYFFRFGVGLIHLSHAARKLAERRIVVGSRRIRKLSIQMLPNPAAGSDRLPESAFRTPVFIGVRSLDGKWASRPLGCSARRPRYRARSGLLRRCTPARVPVEQAQSRSGPLNQLTKFFARFEERNSLRWHLDPSAGLWIASRAATPLSRVEGAESPNLHLVAGSQGTDDAVQYRADDDV